MIVKLAEVALIALFVFLTGVYGWAAADKIGLV